MAEYGWNMGDDSPGYRWIEGRDGSICDGAVRGGVDKDGSPLFVGRAIHESDLMPAKISEVHGCAFVSWGGEEHRKTQYDVLCSTRAVWQAASYGAVPEGAISVGRTGEGELLYVGRVFHDGTMTPGKVHPSHQSCYIPYDGVELSFSDYEILVIKS